MSETRSHALLERLLVAHRSHYDISRDHSFAGRTFPGYGEFHSYGEKYVLSKRAKLWEVNSHDYLFIDIADSFNKEAAQGAIHFMTEQAITKVNAGPNHMSSGLTLVVIANSASDEAHALFRKTRFRKNFLFSIHGWTDLRLALIDLSRPPSDQVTVNAAGKSLRDMLVGNLALSDNE